jgi:hypothetical protein
LKSQISNFQFAIALAARQAPQARHNLAQPGGTADKKEPERHWCDTSFRTTGKLTAALKIEGL